MRHRVIIAIALLLGITASCKKQEVGPQPPAYELTVLIGTDGFGDGNYNDNMLAGILEFCKEHRNVSLSLQQPESIADAGLRLDAWLSDKGTEDRALVLASNSYKPILQGKPAPEKGRVLILETEDSFPGHSSYIIRRYGASWLCGAMAKDFTPFIVKAMDGNDMIDESARGFLDGFRTVSDEYSETWTLADGPEGFSMRDSTYRFVFKKLIEFEDSHDYAHDILFFPLLGGSLPGIFDFSRYNGFVSIAGMDVDCSVYNPWIVHYSLCINNNLVLKTYLEDWLEGRPWPEHAQFDLESGFVQVLVNRRFYNSQIDLLEKYEEYYPVAVEKEKEYEME